MNLLTLPGAAPALVILARVLPVVALCPWLGAAGVPALVRLGLVLVLTGWGVSVGLVSVPADDWMPAVVLEQLLVGALFGSASAFGANIALAAGRWSDLFRGASAEALNPGTGSRESAGGELLSRLVVVGMAAGPGLGLTVTLLMRSFHAVVPGTFSWSEASLAGWLRATGELLGAGVAVAAPIAAATLAVDLALAALSRLSPALSTAELNAPLRLVLGLGFVAGSLGNSAGRLGDLGLNFFEALMAGGGVP